MISSFRPWLLAIALLTGVLLVACGGNGDDGDSGNGVEPTATVPAGDGDEPQDGDGDADGGDGIDADGEVLSGIPIPSGADEISSGSFSGSVPFVDPTGDVDADAFTTLEFAEYELDASPEEVIEFYQDELSDWDEVFVFSGGVDGDEGGFGVWTRNDGEAAVWLGASVVDGKTELIVIFGTQE